MSAGAIPFPWEVAAARIGGVVFFVNAEIPLPSSDAGNLPEGVPERELEDEFGKFGVLRKVWVARKPSGFGE